jgi:hypothetical protein
VAPVRVECSKSVRLPGGFYYTVREARDNYPCFFCGGVIPKKSLYIEERFASVVRRYHYECFNRVVEGTSAGVRAVESPRGVVLCKYA